MYKRLRGFGFHRLPDGIWVRPVVCGHWLLSSGYRVFDAHFWSRAVHVPILTVSVHGDENCDISIHLGRARTVLIEGARRAEMIEVVQRQLITHKVRGTMPPRVL